MILLSSYTKNMMQKIFYFVLAIAICFAAVVFLKMQNYKKASKDKEVLAVVSALFSALESTKAELGRYPENFCDAGFTPHQFNVLLKYKPGTDSFQLSGTHLESGYRFSINEKRDRLEGDSLADDPDVQLLGPENPLNCD